MVEEFRTYTDREVVGVLENWTIFIDAIRVSSLRRSPLIILRKSALTCCKAEFSFAGFFSIWVFFHEYSGFTG